MWLNECTVFLLSWLTESMYVSANFQIYRVLWTIKKILREINTDTTWHIMGCVLLGHATVTFLYMESFTAFTSDISNQYSSRCRIANMICSCTLQVVLTEWRCGLHPDRCRTFCAPEWVIHSELNLTSVVAASLPAVAETLRSWTVVNFARESNPHSCWVLGSRRISRDFHFNSYMHECDKGMEYGITTEAFEFSLDQSWN